MGLFGPPRPGRALRVRREWVGTGGCLRSAAPDHDHAGARRPNLAPAAATDPDDITRIASLTMIAWCMEREPSLVERPISDLMTAYGPGAIVLAHVHPEPLRDAVRAQRQSLTEPMAALPEPMRSATHAHVLIHLDGSAVRPWSLFDKVCAFATRSSDPAIEPVSVALEDIVEDLQPETARARLRLMLASATHDRHASRAGNRSHCALTATAPA